MPFSKNQRGKKGVIREDERPNGFHCYRQIIPAPKTKRHQKGMGKGRMGGVALRTENF